jgi:hypothetical protein
MNDPFVHAQAKKLAARLLKEETDVDARIAAAYRLLFGRPPTSSETAAATEYLAKVGGDRAWESLARALFLSNEFVYLD